MSARVVNSYRQWRPFGPDDDVIQYPSIIVLLAIVFEILLFHFCLWEEKSGIVLVFPAGADV